MTALRHKRQHAGWTLQTDWKMAAFVCDVFCMHVKSVSQHWKYLQTVNEADLKHVTLMSFCAGQMIWLCKSQHRKYSTLSIVPSFSVGCSTHWATPAPDSSWSLCTLNSHACQVRVTVCDSDLCCCACVTCFVHEVTPLCVDSHLYSCLDPKGVTSVDRFVGLSLKTRLLAEDAPFCLSCVN